MDALRFPASIWWANTRSTVDLAGRRRSALLVAVNLAAAAIYLVRFGHGIGLGGYRLDLDVYRTGARMLLHGGDLYGRLPRLGDGHELSFTYPPFAALSFIPFAILGYSTANWLLTAATIVSVAASLRCFAANAGRETGARMRRLLPWALPAALLLEPVRSTLTYGQINALLMALVAFDCLTRAPRWPRGVLVGVAAALKLTPAVFLLFFLLRRDLRSAARAGLSFAACTSAGFALAPHDSLRYWTQIAYQPARIGGISYASNQSVLGALARLGLSNPARAWLWLALSLVVAALAVTGMRGALKANQVTSALSLNAAAGLLIAPISWSHHWVWAAPALLTCLSTTDPNRRRLLTFAVPALLIFAIGPHWLLPSGGGRELHWAWWQQVVGDSYVLIGLAVLTQAAVKNLLPRPGRQDPSTEGRQSAPHDQEVGSVPSKTRGLAGEWTTRYACLPGGEMTVVVGAREDFTLEAFRRVTVDGEGVIIGPAALRIMVEARAGFERLLRSDPRDFIYGVTTLPGVEVGTAVPPEELREYARRFRGVGRGFGRDCLDERVVRGIVFARLADFIGGHAKVRPELAQRVAALLDSPLPRVPLDGQGGAGEILPLMHVMAAVDAGDLVEGEGMALINGSPCATALAADVTLHAGHRLQLAEAIFALSIEALAAPLDAYDEALDDLGCDEAERTVLHHLRGHLRGAVTSGRLAHQAPVSYRILPQVLGQAQRAVQAVAHAATTALGSVTENPVYLPAIEGQPSGRVLSTGGFHNGAAAPAINWLTASWADLALIAQRQVTAMHSATSGLPHLLAPPGFIPGASGGATNLFGWVATGLVEEARALAAPTLLPATINDTQNDIATPAFGAYRSQHRAAECLDSVLAILALVSSQALSVTSRHPAPPLAGLLNGIRSVFPPIETEREGQGTQAAELAAIFSRAALTGQLDFPGQRAQASPRPPP